MLSAAGAAYWEHHFRTGLTDGQGHVARPSVVQGGPTGKQLAGAARATLRDVSRVLTPRPTTPTRTQFALAQAAGQGQVNRNRPDVQAALAASRAYFARGKTLDPHSLLAPARVVSHLAEAGASRLLGAVGPQAAWERHPQRQLGPVPASIATPLSLIGRAGKAGTRAASSLALGPDLTAALSGGRHSGFGLGLDAALLPLNFTGIGETGRLAARGAETALRGGLAGSKEIAAGRGLLSAREAASEAARAPGLFGKQQGFRTLKIGERAVQIPSRSQSRFSQLLLDRPADAFSSRFPELPVAGSRARAIRHEGRLQQAEQRRTRLALEHHVQALPKQGSPEDVAHFWWAQLPETMRNKGGLVAVRNRLQSDLRDLSQGPVGGRKLVQADQPQRMRDLSAAIAKVDQTIAHNPKLNQRAIDAVHALSADRKATLIDAGLLNPEGAANREKLVTRWLGGATYETRTPGKQGIPSIALRRKQGRVGRLQTVYDKAVERAGQTVEYKGRILSREEGQARLNALEARHQKLIEDTMGTMKGGVPFDPAETARRNIARANAQKVTRGKRGGREGMPSRGPQTQAEELRQRAHDQLDRLAEKHAEEPWAKAYTAQRDEISRLRNSMTATEPGLGERIPTPGEFGRTPPTENLRLTLEQRKRVGDVVDPASNLSVELRKNLPQMEHELRKMIAAHNAPAADLLETRAAHNRLLRLGNEAEGLVKTFSEATGQGEGRVAGLEGIRQRVETLTEQIKKVRGDAPEELVSLRSQVTELRKQIRAAEAPRSRRIEGVVPRIVTPRGDIVEPIGTQRVLKLGAALSVAKDELASAEKAAERRIKPTGVLGGPPEPGGGEAFIGHRPETPGVFGRAAAKIRPGVKKVATPKGVGQENKMDLLSSGRVRMSTHVAAEDWQHSNVYKDSTRIRDVLYSMGSKLPQAGGEISDHPVEGMMIVNRHGDPVPRGWNTDKLAKLSEAGNGDALRTETKKILKTFLGDGDNWKEIVDTAKATGVADDLRMLPEKEVERFYRQFQPVGAGTKGGKVYDRIVDATAASLIFARVGYVPKNIAQNIVMAVPHQGPRIFSNMSRSMQLAPIPGRKQAQSELDQQLWRHLVSETGGGVSGSIKQEAASKALGYPAEKVTGLADSPFRVSALLNELANKGVISKTSFHLSEADKAKALDFLTNPAHRGHLNEAMQTAKDAMGDFDRMNPTTRKWARRFLIVPGWLAAGTRYPAKFATSYPGRTAAIGYAAAGEPGAPPGLQVNPPVTKALAGGLPSFMQGVKTGPKSIYRVSSMIPASLPADIGFSAWQGHPLKAAGYANPALESLINLSQGQITKPSGETKNVGYLKALQAAGQRLAPNYSFIRDEITGPSGGGLYPTTSRVERLKRESGVLPVKYDPQVAARMRAGERGMSQTVNAIDRQQGIEQRLAAAGHKPGVKLRQAFTIQVTRNKRLDKIHASGLDFQKQAYRSDVEYAQSLGKIGRQEAQAMLASGDKAVKTKTAAEAEAAFKKARKKMGYAYFGNDVIQTATDYLKSKGH